MPIWVKKCGDGCKEEKTLKKYRLEMINVEFPKLAERKRER